MSSRREFFAQGSLGLLGAALGVKTPEANAEAQTPAPPQQPTPGSPTVFGTAPPAGPAISTETLKKAEKLVRVDFGEAHLKEAAGNWQQAMAPVYERRTGPRRLALDYGDVPATVWNPEMTPFGEASTRQSGMFEPGNSDPGSLPRADEDIAFSTVAQLSGWIRKRQLTSERLTGIYLERLKRFQPKLNCVITLTEEHALRQAKAADAEIASGRYRGPLHGIPWGAKDLLDTAGIQLRGVQSHFETVFPPETPL